MKYDYDLLIGGSGLAGNCLALALKDCGLKIAIIEAQTREALKNSPSGDRALALSAGTVTMLDALGAWQGIAEKATPITRIHISDKGHFGKTRLSAQKQGVKALGYVIAARDIETQLANLVAESEMTQIMPARIVGLISGDDAVHVSLKQAQESINLTAKLLVGADGGQSTVRALLNIEQHKTDYQQTALVTTVKGSLPHKNIAYERFTDSGPLALLPTTNNEVAVIWTRSTEQADDLMGLSETDFIQQLQQCFGYRLGQLSLTAPRRAFPLHLIRTHKMVVDRSVIIGNAAHQLHPVAGQGFNLGLRDVVLLAEQLLKQHSEEKDIGASDFLSHYQASRQKDHENVVFATDSLVKLFSNQSIPLAVARNTGLTLLDHLPFAKTILTHHAMGFSGRLPRLGTRQ